MRPTDLVDPAARLRLENAIFEVERHTQGEIVVVVVRACDEYGSAGWRLGVVLAVLAFCGVASFAAAPSPWQLLAAQAIGLGLGHALGRIDTIRRRLLSLPLVETRVGERARRAFAENGLVRTRGRTGILLFVALLERRMVVLADEGIHRALDPSETWQQVVDLAVGGLAAGRGVDGLEAAIRRCGEILSHHVPAPERDPDELSNRVVLED